MARPEVIRRRGTEKPPRKRQLRSLFKTAYGLTSNASLLLSVPLGVFTETGPVLAPAGTAVVIADPDELTLNDSTGVPLNIMLVAPCRLLPRITTFAPTPPRPDLFRRKALA